MIPVAGGRRPPPAPSDPAPPAGVGTHEKTAKAPVLMAEAWTRTPSIGRTGMLTPVCEAARLAPADAACLGSGSAARTLVHPCIGRLSVAGGTARARWLRQLAAVCWAEVLPATTTEADRALGPIDAPVISAGALAILRGTACVIRGSRSPAGSVSGLQPIGSGRRTGGSRRHPYPLRLAASG